MSNQGATSTKVDQFRDYALEEVCFSRLRVRYAYLRSSESRSHDLAGQDYLAFRHIRNGFAFVVCDGVGQSFCGDLAAKFLGDRLVDKAERIHEEILRKGGSVQKEMTTFLQNLTLEGQQLVQSALLPDSLPYLLKEALESSRGYGSETMFVFGILELPPKGTDPHSAPQLWLCWLGDTEVQVFSSEGKPILLGGNGKLQERWSTVKGVKGSLQVHAWQESAEKIGRIIAYSDGVSSISDQLYGLVQQPENLQPSLEKISQAVDSDDVSLIDISLPSVFKNDLTKHQADTTPFPYSLAISMLMGMSLLIGVTLLFRSRRN